MKTLFFSAILRQNDSRVKVHYVRCLPVR